MTDPVRGPTPREQEILTHLLDGESPKEIAAALVLSTTSVANHLKRLRAIYRARHCYHLMSLGWQRRARARPPAVERAVAVVDRSGKGVVG